ncbi:hypothetical protein ACIQSP_09940 [Streptomyces nigra]
MTRRPGRWWPKLMTYDARTNEHAVRQRGRRAEAAAAPPVPAER